MKGSMSERKEKGILQRTARCMVREMQGVELLKDRKMVKYLMLMLSSNETLDLMVMESKVMCWG